MAYTEFYMQTTGDNLNSGSTTSDAASVTSTNGDWGNAAANRFTAASGTPFSGVVAGEWASIYLDAATSTVYTAEITAVNGGGASIDLSATNKIGTAPATGSTGRSCKVGGAWGSLAVFTSLGTTTVALSTRINVKAGTYANTTTSRTMAIGGATTTPVWIRGYNVTPGDLDDDFSTAKPLWSWTTATLTISGVHVLLTNISTTTAATSTALSWSGANGKLSRCRIEATGAGAASRALSPGAAVLNVSACHFKASSSPTEVVLTSASSVFLGCIFEGGGHGLNVASVSTNVINSYFKNNGNHGINFNASAFSLNVFSSTFSAITNDAIRIAQTPAASYIVSCNFYNSGGYDINNSTGTDTNLVSRSNNNTNKSGGTNHENGFGDSPRFQTQIDSGTPVTSSSNPTPPSGSLARLNGFPTSLEGQSVSNYRDIGCIQHQDSGSGPATRGIVIGG